MNGLLVKAAAIVAVGAVLGLADRRAWNAKLRPDAPAKPVPAAGDGQKPPVTPGPKHGEPAKPLQPGSGDRPPDNPAPPVPIPEPPPPAPPTPTAKIEPGHPQWKPTPPEQLKAKPGHLTLQDAHDQHTFQIATFLDARNPEEFIAGHIPRAHLAPLSAFRDNKPPAILMTLPKEAPIIIYCGGGDCEASEDVQLLLQQAGHLQVFVLHDGFPGWKAVGYPVETGEPK